MKHFYIEEVKIDIIRKNKVNNEKATHRNFTKRI